MRDATASPVVARRRSASTCCAWLEAHREEILNGQLKVFFQDECHLLWGDICGYVWGKTKN